MSMNYRPDPTVTAPRLRIKAALIDMDGTLYDSMPRHVKAWSRLSDELGIAHDPDEFYLYEGMTGAATLRLLFKRAGRREPSKEEIERLYARKTELFSLQEPVGPMAGAAEMLETLMERGIERVLVTGSGQRSLIDRLEADFPGAFSKELMITSADVAHGKPDPEPYVIAMQRAGVNPPESMVVENAPLGVKSGASSGAFTVGLTTGPIPSAALFESGANVVYASMKAFSEALPSLLDSLCRGDLTRQS